MILFLWNNDPKNRTYFFFSKKHMTLRIELIKKSKNWSFLTNMTHSKNSSLLNLFIWLKELNLFPQNDSKILFFGLDSELIFFWLWLSEWYCFVYFDFYNWTFFILRPRGLNFFFDLIWPKGLFFLIWFTESNTFWTRLKESNTFWTRLKESNTFWTRLKELIHSFFSEWLKDLNFFWNMTQWIELFFSIRLKELNLFCHSKELNLLLLFHDAKNWTHFSETQLNTFLIPRIEHSFWTRLTELNSFWMWLRQLNRIFKNLTQRIESSSLVDSKNWTLFTKWLKELNLFEDYLTPRCFNFLWLGRWNFFSIWIKELRLFFSSISLKNDWPFFVHDSQNWTFFQHDSQNWTLLKNMIHRDWTLLFNMTQRKSPFFSMTSRIILFYKNVWLN